MKTATTPRATRTKIIAEFGEVLRATEAPTGVVVGGAVMGESVGKAVVGERDGESLCHCALRTFSRTFTQATVPSSPVVCDECIA